MRKYAAATALVIALNITMLTPAVSAGLCPADGPVGRTYCRCLNQCWVDAIRRYAVGIDDKKYQACLSTCVSAAEAARR
jgi:hypothetical protein